MTATATTETPTVKETAKKGKKGKGGRKPMTPEQKAAAAKERAKKHKQELALLQKRCDALQDLTAAIIYGVVESESEKAIASAVQHAGPFVESAVKRLWECDNGIHRSNTPRVLPAFNVAGVFPFLGGDLMSVLDDPNAEPAASTTDEAGA